MSSLQLLTEGAGPASSELVQALASLREPSDRTLPTLCARSPILFVTATAIPCHAMSELGTGNGKLPNRSCAGGLRDRCREDYPNFILVTYREELTFCCLSKPNHPVQPAFKAWPVQIQGLDCQTREGLEKRSSGSTKGSNLDCLYLHCVPLPAERLHMRDSLTALGTQNAKADGGIWSATLYAGPGTDHNSTQLMASRLSFMVTTTVVALPWTTLCWA